ncbi:hypothetical protein DNTS_011865 [Danionella cerebrum]|uniref:Uncharacterized protein n=1 Tax=Danionella cerebrum TaxID=2873325 RepID=A0A553Q7B6_9TELE|nr:hypothetical protein DNTS_011865 [Danionella translucida]
MSPPSPVELRYHTVAQDAALGTLLAVVLCALLKLVLSGARRRRARVPVLVVGAGPVGLVAALAALRSGRTRHLQLLEARGRASLLRRPQQVALDPRSVRFLRALGVDFDNMEGCWRERRFFTRLGVFQEHLLSLLERERRGVELSLGTRFSEDFLRRIPAAERPRVIIVADGSSGDSCSVLGISDEFIVESCGAYGANATIERLDQRQVPTPEIRVHGLLFDLSAYGIDAQRESRRGSLAVVDSSGFHLKIYGSFRNRCMALACQEHGQGKMVHFLRHTANTSIMRSIFHQSFNTYKSDMEPRLMELSSNRLQCSRKLFEIQLSHRRITAAFMEAEQISVTVEGAAARLLNFDTGSGVNLGLEGLESLGAFISRTAVALDRGELIEALSEKIQHARQVSRSFCRSGVSSAIFE